MIKTLLAVLLLLPLFPHRGFPKITGTQFAQLKAMANRFLTIIFCLIFLQGFVTAEQATQSLKKGGHFLPLLILHWVYEYQIQKWLNYS